MARSVTACAGSAVTLVRAALLIVVVAVACPDNVCAQISARDRQSAAQAYDRGSAAYLSRDYAEAARWFETAYRLAPASAALVQAVRSHGRAGNSLRAATLGLRLQALYADDADAQRAARDALREAGQFVRVDVECESCTVQVDGAVMGHASFFVEPDREHTVEAAFETGTRRETVRGAAGEQRTLRFDAPPPPDEPPPPDDDEPVNEEPPADDTIPPVREPPPAGRIDVIPLGVTIAAIAATAVMGGVLIWSAVDTLDGVPAYEMNPTVEGLADGQSREARTNWLIGGTSLVAATTLILAIFTDWGNGPAPATDSAALERPWIAIQPEGAALGLRGRF